MNKPAVLRLKSAACVVVSAAANDETLEIHGDLRALSSKLLDQSAQALRQFCIRSLKLLQEQVSVEHVLTINRATGSAQFEWHVVLPNECLTEIAASSFLFQIGELLRALTDDISFQPPAGQDATHLEVARMLRAAAPASRDLPAGSRIDCDQWTTQVPMPKKLGGGPEDHVVFKPDEGVGRVTGSDWYERVFFVLFKGHRRPTRINFDEEAFNDMVEDARLHRHNLYEVRCQSRWVNGKLDYASLTGLKLFQEDFFGDDDGSSKDSE
jgi:hypothetical protein